MNKAIFITVRTDSTRLPKKCLLEIKGKKTIEYLIERVKKSKESDIIVLCTTEKSRDDILCEIAERKGIKYFRGSEKDKLERWRGAAEKYDVDFFVTADGDDLFCEPELIDLAFKQYEKNKPDFIEEKPGENLPVGAFTYGIKTSALKKVCEIKNTDDTEMMSGYFTETNRFKVEKFKGFSDKYKRPEIRMTLDYKEDFDFFKKIIEHFGDREFNLMDIINYLDKNPEIIKINQFRNKDYLENQKRITNVRVKEEEENNLKNPVKYLGNELKYIEKVLNSENWSATAGSWNNKLETEFAKKIGTKYCVAMNSGTSTLHAALEAAGVNPGDEVISPALTVIMDAAATIHANAIPVFADVDPETFNINPEDIRRKITSKTKAIITVSLYGCPPEMDEIMKIAKEYNLVVIEDNAQSMLNTYKGKRLGTIGHLASYSFENTKLLSCGEGGAIVTNDEELAKKVRKIGGHGFKNLRAEEGRVRLNADIFQNPLYERHDCIGWNYRLSEFGAAITLAQLEKVNDLINMRIESAKLFIEIMNECDFIIPQKTPDYSTNSYYSLGARYLGKEKYGISWQEFRRMYIEEGGDGFYSAWQVPYLEPSIRSRTFISRYPEIYSNIFYKPGLCPVAEKIQRQLMQFKTNYRDLDLAKEKAEALKRTIIRVKNMRKTKINIENTC